MPHWFRTGPLQKTSNKKLTWPVMSANLMCCDLWPGTWGKRKNKLLAVLLDFSTQKLLQEDRSQSQGIYYWAGNTIKGKNKYQQEKRKGWLSVLTHLPSEILMVGGCFNNDSLNWWQLLSRTVLGSSFMFHQTSNEEEEGHCHKEGCAWMLFSKVNTFLIFACLGYFSKA